MPVAVADLNDARRWQLDRDAALAYRQFLVPVVFEPWTERLVNRAALFSGCRVLDLACGTGAKGRAGLGQRHLGSQQLVPLPYFTVAAL